MFRQRVEPYMHQVLMVWNQNAFHFQMFPYFMGFVYLVLEYLFWIQYEDPVGQEAARKTVPIYELEEKALVSLAKVLLYFTTSVIFFSHSGIFVILFQCKMYSMIILLLSLLQVYLDFLKGNYGYKFLCCIPCFKRWVFGNSYKWLFSRKGISILRKMKRSMPFCCNCFSGLSNHSGH